MGGGIKTSWRNTKFGENTFCIQGHQCHHIGEGGYIAPPKLSPTRLSNDWMVIVGMACLHLEEVLMWLLSYTLSGYAPSLSYENLLHHFRLPALSSRQMQHAIIFTRNIFRLNIDSADLLASFALHIPTRSTRAYKLFNEPRARVNTVQSSLFCRLPRVDNSFFKSVQPCWRF